MHTVQEILARKGPQFNYIDAEAFVRDAITLLKSENISYLIVSKDGKYMGLFSERDYTHKVILMNRHSDTTTVKEVLTRDLPIVTGSDSAEHCMRLMNSYKTRYLPVFDEYEFKGVITIHDMMRESLAEHEDDIKNKFGEDTSNTERNYWI